MWIVSGPAIRSTRLADFVLCGPDESVPSMREMTPPISASGAKRRSTRIVHSVPLIVTWTNLHAKTIIEETEAVSINCHGCRYYSRQRPKKNATVIVQVTENKDDEYTTAAGYPARVAWIRKSRRLDGLYQVGAELGTPQNIWDIDEVPEDWAAFSSAAKEDPAAFQAEVERMLNSAQTATHYQLLDVEARTPRSEVKRHFYRLARRFHPDHHMDHPEWTLRLLKLMDVLTTAYKTLSDDEAKKEYDALLARRIEEEPSDSQKLAAECLQKARECMAEKNYAGCILWLHRAIEHEPNSSGHRTLLGRCLSAIPEYRREAVEQFERAIELDPRNLSAYFHYGEMLEQMKLPWRARVNYVRVLELDMTHREARERLNHLDAGSPRVALRPSLLGRLTGRR
jgi:tetratricopeptide (TPR) repeat protein